MLYLISAHAYFKRTRQSLVRAFENPQEDYLAVADTHVNRSAARGNITTFVKRPRVVRSVM